MPKPKKYNYNIDETITALNAPNPMSEPAFAKSKGFPWGNFKDWWDRQKRKGIVKCKKTPNVWSRK